MAITTTPSGSKHNSTCLCPACLGLECLERPRYFSGQLLTETDLTSEQAYMLAKNRLHNRYLHGPGTVCGLEVVCGDCDGHVTVTPGYAIDPCGNDIIVCQEHDFALIDEIRKCLDARKKKRRRDCEPYQPAPDPGCRDVEEHWCVTIEYEEKEARPTTALRREKSPVCGCGCGSNGSSGKNGGTRGCGCGCHNGKASAVATTSTATAEARANGACEPTRILESYRLGVIEGSENPCGSLSDRLRNTLLMRLLQCWTSIQNSLQQRLSVNDLRAILLIYVTPVPDVTVIPGITPSSLQAALCRFRQFVIDLYADNPLSVRCTIIRALDQILCPPPADTETVNAYALRIKPIVAQLFALIFQYVLDCICHQLLPPCGENPTDNQLILACVTIRNCKIVRICNFDCRRFAGSFPSFYYWLSVIPITALLGFVVKTLCCLPDVVRADKPGANGFDPILRMVDPGDQLRQAIFAGDFALPKSYAAMFAQLRDLLPKSFLSEVSRSGNLNLAALAGKSTDEARRALVEAKVNVVEREVSSDADVPLSRTLTASSFAAPGESVVMYRKGNQVLAFGRYDVAEEFTDKKADLKTMRLELDALREEVDRLKSGKPPDRPAPRRKK